MLNKTHNKSTTTTTATTNQPQHNMGDSMSEQKSVEDMWELEKVAAIVKIIRKDFFNTSMKSDSFDMETDMRLDSLIKALEAGDGGRQLTEVCELALATDMVSK
jgi:hypothetical protein